VAAQISAIMGERPDGDLTDLLFERSEGIPLFVEELLGSRRSRLSLPRKRASVPQPHPIAKLHLRGRQYRAELLQGRDVDSRAIELSQTVGAGIAAETRKVWRRTVMTRRCSPRSHA
jgi:hypothetical protein